MVPRGGPAQRITLVEELFSPSVGARLRCGVLQDLADLQADFDGHKLAEALTAAEPAAQPPESQIRAVGGVFIPHHRRGSGRGDQWARQLGSRALQAHA